MKLKPIPICRQQTQFQIIVNEPTRLSIRNPFDIVGRGVNAIPYGEGEGNRAAIGVARERRVAKQFNSSVGLRCCSAAPGQRLVRFPPSTANVYEGNSGQ